MRLKPITLRKPGKHLWTALFPAAQYRPRSSSPSPGQPAHKNTRVPKDIFPNSADEDGETPAKSTANSAPSHTAPPCSALTPEGQKHASEYDSYSHDHSKSLYSELHTSDGSAPAPARPLLRSKCGTDTSSPTPNDTGHRKQYAALSHTYSSPMDHLP